jgi:hypothetical protein
LTWAGNARWSETREPPQDAVEDPLWPSYAGEVPVAYVMLTEPEAVSANDLRAWASTRVPERAALPKLDACPSHCPCPGASTSASVGLLPYVPLPTKLATAVLPVIQPSPSEEPADLATRVETAMQHRLNDLVAQRIPLLG